VPTLVVNCMISLLSYGAIRVGKNAPATARRL